MKCLEVEYADHKLQSQCEKKSTAKRLFGGDEALANVLLARVQQLKAAVTLRDIICMPALHFQALHNRGKNKLEGLFTIDVKTRRDAWRLIIQPLDDDRVPFPPCNIDEISGLVRVVRVERASKHYD